MERVEGVRLMGLTPGEQNELNAYIKKNNISAVQQERIRQIAEMPFSGPSYEEIKAGVCSDGSQ
jgi:hypothetical protein